MVTGSEADRNRILVLDTAAGRLAGRVAAELSGRLPADTEVVAAAVAPEGPGEGVLRIEELSRVDFDVVILLEQDGVAGGPQSRNLETITRSASFVGAPVLLRWPVAGDADDAGGGLPGGVAERVTALSDQGLLQALLAQHHRLEGVLDALQEGIMLHDQHRQVLLFNRAAEKITGYAREQVLGRSCPEIFTPDGLCGSRCPFCHGENPQFAGSRYELSVTDARGEDRRLSLVSVPIDLYDGGLPGVLVSFRDVTEVSQLRRRLRQKDSFHGMVAISESMHEVFDTIRNLATSDYPVLITGESGTGKELAARAIHNESRRGAGPFVPVNCGALPENILESELFGHVRGAFTGAIRDKKGRFELADGGTLFLDEVGELSPAFQVKLLRVLEQKSFEPVGAERSVSVDVRIISATNRDLRKLVDEGSFRSDLFYRLAVVPVELPPLRRRREDLPVLVEQVLGGVRAETGKEIEGLDDAAMDTLYLHDWPGNVRELINVLQFASIRCPGRLIEPRHLPPELAAGRPSRPAAAGAPARRGKLDSRAVSRALEQTGGNKVKAARLLGVGRATLYRFLARHPLQ
ncbi:MAG: sigma-54-dependent Fis family transcriptional regulator [Deltaproteobacteria bacterium]|nr:MAG: sigma-54-dependent Fis family transcriptional regulator [Deltaproteobacteria bacterium]